MGPLSNGCSKKHLTLMIAILALVGVICFTITEAVTSGVRGRVEATEIRLEKQDDRIRANERAVAEMAERVKATDDRTKDMFDWMRKGQR